MYCVHIKCNFVNIIKAFDYCPFLQNTIQKFNKTEKHKVQE
jgi:hypothetical protein